MCSLGSPRQLLGVERALETKRSADLDDRNLDMVFLNTVEQQVVPRMVVL